MTQENLRELLSRVRERLNEAGGSLDSDAREMLATLMRDIERALGRGAVPPSTAKAHAPRLESLAVQFEAEHPALAEVLRQVTDALAKAGI